MITYPGLGHRLSPVIGFCPGSGMFLQKASPTSEYVLADLYAWLEPHSGLSHSFATTAASTLGANTSSLNTNTSSSSKT
ncbi:MAG: hypothetical protein M3044_02710 [Thermoproteota archaeon]|nr:hypothetical protein [Thermoproteota archaeon]